MLTHGNLEAQLGWEASSQFPVLRSQLDRPRIAARVAVIEAEGVLERRSSATVHVIRKVSGLFVLESI